MRIIPANNKCNIMFGTNSVTLSNINPTHFLRYDEIKRIAEEDKLDIFISKSEESEYLAKNDLYTIIAKRDVPYDANGMSKFALPIHGTSSVLTDKKASAREISDQLYETVINSIESLAKNIEKRIGKKPNFLKYFNI